MASLRTHLSLLESSADKHGSLPVFKIPCGQSSEFAWKNATFSQLRQDVENYAKYWTHEFLAKGYAEQSVIGVWLKGTTYLDIVQILSLSRAGFTPQLVSVGIPNPDTVHDILNRANAVALLTDSIFEPLLAHSPFSVFYKQEIGAHDVKDFPPLSNAMAPVDPERVMFIFHTSGSTSGRPKLVPVTAKWIEFAIEKMSNIGVASTPPEVKQDVVTAGGSFCHMASFLLLLGYLERSGCIVLPCTIPYSACELQQIISQCHLTTLNMFSAFLSNIFKVARQDASLLSDLQQLEHIYYSGLPIKGEDEQWAQQQRVPVANVFASTEVGIMMGSDEGTRDSSQLSLHPYPGTSYEFHPIEDHDALGKKLVELVVLPTSPDCPSHSLCDPRDGKFRTGDLFEEVTPGRYLGRGRNDDWIKMENSGRCNTSSIEANVMQTCGGDLVEAAIVVGTSRPTPVLVIEGKEGGGETKRILVQDEGLKARILERIMPFAEQGLTHERIDNMRCIIVASKGSLPRTASKGNIRRKMVEELYKAQIDSIFAN